MPAMGMTVGPDLDPELSGQLRRRCTAVDESSLATVEPVGHLRNEQRSVRLRPDGFRCPLREPFAAVRSSDDHGTIFNSQVTSSPGAFDCCNCMPDVGIAAVHDL
eukprot:2468502-Prymnesium_polylepis.2